MICMIGPPALHFAEPNVVTWLSFIASDCHPVKLESDAVDG